MSSKSVILRRSSSSGRSLTAAAGATSSSFAEKGADATQLSRSGWLAEHRWPLLAMLAILVSGMAYTLWWESLFFHAQYWEMPADIWGTFRTAQYVIWGGEGQIYNSVTHFLTFPGIALLFAPIAKIAGVFHMSESFPINLAHPTAWLLLGPATMLSGSVLLFPLDALAKRLSVPARRRIVLVWMEAILIWPTLVFYGHPEDSLALAFAVYGLMAAFDGAWMRIGIFFALAIVFQPLTLLILPIALAYVPRRRWPSLGAIIVLPSALVLLPPLIQQWKQTFYVLTKQPNFPLGNHVTPWFTLAPVLQPGHVALLARYKYVKLSNGHHRLELVTVKTHLAPIVSAGPGRSIVIVLAIAIGVFVAMKRPSFTKVLWFAALALSLRCVFECVMVPYYLVPGLALALVVASTAKTSRFVLTALAVAACTRCSYLHVDPWPYYIAMTGTLALVLCFSWPQESPPSPRADPEKACHSIVV